MNRKYKSVTDIRELKEYVGDAMTVSFDYETAPDEPYREDDKAALDPHRAHIVERTLMIMVSSKLLLEKIS